MFLIDRTACIVTSFLIGVGRLVDAGGHIIEVLAGVAVAVFTLYLARIASRTDRHFSVSERAYVKMSHLPPGISGINVSNRGIVRIQVKNFGKTPADVTDAFADFMVRGKSDKTEDVPPYRPDKPDRLPETAFLVTKDKFFIELPIVLTGDERADVFANKKLLIVYGFVDYIDKFGTRHRGGYARMYDPSVDMLDKCRTVPEEEARNNLPIFPHRDYNYDRPREPGQGNDWP